MTTPITHDILLNKIDELDSIIRKVYTQVLHTHGKDSATIHCPITSADTAQLLEAFAKAQGEYPEITANRDNPYYQRLYEDLHIIMKHIRPVLSKHGLSVSQIVQTEEDGATWLYSRLLHESGQWIQSKLKVLTTRNDCQKIGSALQYYKRFSLMSLLGLTIEFDLDDDDGELAMQEHRTIKNKGTKTNTSYSSKGQSSETITKEQLEELEYSLGEYLDVAEDVMDGLRIQSLSEMPKDKYHSSVKRIREIINDREKMS